MRIISFLSSNMELTSAIRSYAEEKAEVFEKMTEDWQPAELRIEVGKTTNHHAKGPYFKAEMQLSIPGEVLRATEEAEDLYEAIDKVRDNLRRQLKEYKERKQDARERAPRPGKE
jgi:putative sigma-54 modulation protein